MLTKVKQIHIDLKTLQTQTHTHTHSESLAPEMKVINNLLWCDSCKCTNGTKTKKKHKKNC